MTVQTTYSNLVNYSKFWSIIKIFGQLLQITFQKKKRWKKMEKFQCIDLKDAYAYIHVENKNKEKCNIFIEKCEPYGLHSYVYDEA